MTKQRYQTTCVECLKEIWISKHDAPATHCPECGAKLPEQSSEDADDGYFAEAEANN